MKSIKEKSFELFPEMQTDSDDWDVIEERCDRDEQRKAFVKGANYVLDEIERIVNSAIENKLMTIPTWRLNYIIKQLKK